MTQTAGQTRTDSVSRLIKASRRAIYQALTDAKAVSTWLPPNGMSGRIDVFEPWVGGAYRMTLTYDRPDPAAPGKSSADADVVAGRFVALDPDERVAQLAGFESDDPDFAGAMTMSWILEDAPGGTRVTVTAENVPAGISRSDHEMGINSSLDNLAAYLAQA